MLKHREPHSLLPLSSSRLSSSSSLSASSACFYCVVESGKLCMANEYDDDEYDDDDDWLVGWLID